MVNSVYFPRLNMDLIAGEIRSVEGGIDCAITLLVFGGALKFLGNTFVCGYCESIEQRLSGPKAFVNDRRLQLVDDCKRCDLIGTIALFSSAGCGVYALVKAFLLQIKTR